jgi:hypothetical protein
MQAGTFEMQLIDLEAQKAADAAVASAIAATSALTATAATPALPAPADSVGALQPSAARAAGAGSADEALLAAAVAAAAVANVGQKPPESFGGSLADAPALGQHGVLASVRVSNGRAMGTLGLERELQNSRQAKVPRKVSATALHSNVHFTEGRLSAGCSWLTACTYVACIIQFSAAHTVVDGGAAWWAARARAAFFCRILILVRASHASMKLWIQ